MFTLEITESAESDLDQITDYLSHALSNPKAALDFLDDVERVADTLLQTSAQFLQSLSRMHHVNSATAIC